MKAKIVIILMVLFTGATMELSAQHRHEGRDRHRRGDKVIVVKDVPGHHSVVAYQGVNYRYADGRYYRPVRGGYERLAAPPAGIAVNFVPNGYKVRMHRGVRYYYRGNVCYREVRPHAYVVTARPW